MIANAIVWYVIISVTMTVGYHGTHDNASWGDSLKWGFGWPWHLLTSLWEVGKALQDYFRGR